MSRVTWSVDREGSSRSGAFRGWVAGGAKYGNRDGGGRCRRDTRSRLLKLSGFLGEQRQQQLRRLGETGPYKDNEVRGTYDSTRLVSSAAFQQGPVTFYVRTWRPPTRPNVLRGNSVGNVSDPWPFRSFALLRFHLPPLPPSIYSTRPSLLSSFGIPRIFLGFPQSREDESANFQYSNDLGRKVGYLGTRAPLKRVLRPASGHHLPCSLLPFSFDSSLAAAPPSISQFLASENFSAPLFLPHSPEKQSIQIRNAIKNALSILSREIEFFFSIFSLLPSVFRVLERKKEIVNSGLSRKVT